jgi:hypothetical protein
MLWYGFKGTGYKNKIRNLKKQKNYLEKQYSYKSKYNIQLNKQNFRLHKPFQWDLLILKNINTLQKTIYINSPIYKISLPIPVKINEITFDTNTNSLKLFTLYINNDYRLLWKLLLRTLRLFYSPLFLKVKFKGKGYYIYKNKRSTITPQFGYAHRLYLYSYFISVKFLSKTSIIVFGFELSDLVFVSLGIKKMRPINIFTGRGVRFSRQIIYKKVGKVSSYR